MSRNPKGKVRPLLPTPQPGELPSISSRISELIDEGSAYMPKLSDFGFAEQVPGQEGKVQGKEEAKGGALTTPTHTREFLGGEEQGLKHMNDYFFGSRRIQHYHGLRKRRLQAQLTSPTQSSQLSPWLANGSLSPRSVYHAARQFMQKNASANTKGLDVFIKELFQLDFYKFWYMKVKEVGFSEYGCYDRKALNWANDAEILQRWKDGKTGMPFIDALMRQLNTTGWLPGRGRESVCCYLTRDLKQDWRYGAHYFEERLVDFEVTSNYGNWNECSGLGPGLGQLYDAVKQSKEADSEGDYIRRWCPELAVVPKKFIHSPWLMSQAEQEDVGVIIGKDYPAPLAVLRYCEPEKYRAEGGIKPRKRKLEKAEQASDAQSPRAQKSGPRAAKKAKATKSPASRSQRRSSLSKTKPPKMDQNDIV